PPSGKPAEEAPRQSGQKSPAPGEQEAPGAEGAQPGAQGAKPAEKKQPEGDPSAEGPAPKTPPAAQEDEGTPGSEPQDASRPSPPEAHPARERLQTARQRMQQAQEKLDKAQREGASEEQEEAIRQLQQAKAELERILRQLREEEIEQVLVALEARLVKMLQLQQEVYDGTQRLDKASADGLSHEQEIEAGRLSSREAEIVSEADRALMLLREEGSAVAVPEALAQARDDMQQVVARLSRANVGEVTLSIEEDIVAALDEMLGAVRKAMEEAEQRRRDSGQGEPGTPQEPALVDALAELQMIRSLQLRVNTRTERYGKLISGKHAETPELVEALLQLAERQDRVYRITIDLETGKNR
ncbi:MAG: hypothetical protein ACYC6Y_17430, partial [Thermoguttaceae bacterium]